MITILFIIVGLIVVNLLLLRYSVQSVEQKRKNTESIDTEDVNKMSDAA